MFKGSTWQCDNCEKEKAENLYPSDWFHVKITKGTSWHNAVEWLEGDYCSQKCMTQDLLKYLKIKLVKKD